ncbi:Hsp70 family protein [Pseudonocardia nigra]|uniref:Hsp70 family protein n=1 Tax=Pseudonocardia nigra TaxID=1921578 RepID=UPI001C5E0E4A|nr:Hsp70 family protein [Pseudonocardia nigra]
MSYLLGIDVGTTRTAAAIGRSGARPGETEIVNLGDRSSAIPSVLYIGDDGGVLVGEAAERRAVTSPDHVVREFKRRIGDPTPLVVAGRAWAPEDLSANLVRWVVDRVAQREGGPAARVAITHPASWGAHKKDRFGRALAAQGLTVTFLAEPQAAALHYAAAERVEPGSTIAVYDFGGGTFDSAVVHKDASGFGLLGRPEGVERLGGIDFDEAVFEHVREGLPEAFDGLDDTDPAVLSAVAAIRRECAEAKEALSSDTEVSIPVLTPAAQGSVRLHRSEFEAMIRPQVEETVDALRRAVTSAGLAPEQLSAVLLVGGSSRIPLVGQLVSEQLGRPVAVDADPKNAIAKGAVLSLAPTAASGTGVAPAHVPAPRTGTPARQPMGAAAAPAAFAAGAAGAVAGGTGTHRPGTGAFPGPAAPPTQRLSGPGSLPPPMAPPPVRPSQTYADPPPVDPDDDGFAYPPPARGQSPARLVGIGGGTAAVVLIATLFLWQPSIPDRAGAVVPGQTVPSSVAVEPTSEPDDDQPPAQQPEPEPDGRPAPPPADQPTVVAPPPVVETSAPPVTETSPPPATTQPPQQTTPPPEPTDPPTSNPPEPTDPAPTDVTQPPGGGGGEGDGSAEGDNPPPGAA